MKIVITADPFIPVPPVNYGGIERIIHFLAEGLTKQGHDVALVAHQDSKVNMHLLKYPLPRKGLIGHVENIFTINSVKAWKPDIIHSFSRLAYLLPFMQSRVPKLMSYQREPTISQIKIATAIARSHSLSFCGCSNYITNQIKPFAECSTVYNGVDINFYNYCEEVYKDAPMVFLGRIEPWKGTHNAVRVALKTGRQLIIAGNIPPEHKNYFKERIRPFLSDSIRYVGPVNDLEKNKLLGSAACLLMPIEWDEPFGIVMAEALACGTPVIGYRRGAVPEVVEHWINGFVVDDFDSMCSAVELLESLSRKKARESAEIYFSSEVIVNNYVTIYESLLCSNQVLS